MQATSLVNLLKLAPATWESEIKLDSLKSGRPAGFEVGAGLQSGHNIHLCVITCLLVKIWVTVFQLNCLVLLVAGGCCHP